MFLRDFALWREAPGIAIALFCLAAANLIAELLMLRFPNEMGERRLPLVRWILLILSLVLLAVLPFFKEQFHWNYDIATGQAVDHYSSYPRSMLFLALSALASALSFGVRYLRDRCRRQAE